VHYQTVPVDVDAIIVPSIPFSHPSPSLSTCPWAIVILELAFVSNPRDGASGVDRVIGPSLWV
jgi:hypothetical protein